MKIAILNRLIPLNLLAHWGLDLKGESNMKSWITLLTNKLIVQ